MWKDSLWEIMELAGKEEHEIAKTNGDIDADGIPYITVFLDGGWSKRSYGHSYTAASGVVRKIECTNHVVKNYSKQLYKIKNDTKSVSLAARKMFTKDIIESLVKSVQGAIYANAHGDINRLKEDIRNTVNHVFENHFNCREDICDRAGETVDDRTPELTNSGAHHHIYGALGQLLTKVDLLIDNETNNRAELYMSLLARFNMGKRLNLIQRDSFQTRSVLSGLKYNEGHLWHYKPWKAFFNRSPGKNLKLYMKQQDEKLRKRKLYHKPKASKKLKFNDSENGKESKKDLDYGVDIAEVVVNKENIEQEVDKLIERLKVSDEQQRKISVDTVGQFDNPLYLTERMHRLTASNFGAIVKRRDSTSCDALVKSILSPRQFSTSATEYGKQNESVAISKYSDIIKQPIRPSGIFIDTKSAFLAASPDGIINAEEIVEVKCLHKVAVSGLQLIDAVRNKQVSCLELQNGEIRLKRSHNYYYQ
ncbi:hypothetical protein ILUMI_27056, partial [Ignelater luminosus]